MISPGMWVDLGLFLGIVHASENYVNPDTHTHTKVQSEDAKKYYNN